MVRRPETTLKRLNVRGKKKKTNLSLREKKAVKQNCKNNNKNPKKNITNMSDKRCLVFI